MTSDELIAEGRRLQRPTVLLTPDGTGEPVAIWYGHDDDEPEDDYRCWISVRANAVPGYDGEGWLSVFTDEESCEGGRVDVTPMPPSETGVRLYARPITVLPPIDAVIARGSAAVGAWLADNGWQRDRRYDSGFRDHAPVEAYEAVERRENPLYGSDAYATLGGWHTGWPDDDWHDLIEATLLVHTYRDAEPWVEAWQLPDGRLDVIQRIT